MILHFAFFNIVSRSMILCMPCYRGNSTVDISFHSSVSFQAHLQNINSQFPLPPLPVGDKTFLMKFFFLFCLNLQIFPYTKLINIHVVYLSVRFMPRKGGGWLHQTHKLVSPLQSTLQFRTDWKNSLADVDKYESSQMFIPHFKVYLIVYCNEVQFFIGHKLVVLNM